MLSINNFMTYSSIVSLFVKTFKFVPIHITKGGIYNSPNFFSFISHPLCLSDSESKIS